MAFTAGISSRALNRQVKAHGENGKTIPRAAEPSTTVQGWGRKFLFSFTKKEMEQTGVCSCGFTRKVELVDLIHQLLADFDAA
jgi:hypothetical protein